MADHTDGYIGIKTKGRNYEEIKEIEQKVADGLTDFRDEKFMYYIFINILWMIISLVLLMYSDLLLQIKIPLDGDNDAFQQCGFEVQNEDDANERLVATVKAFLSNENLSEPFSAFKALAYIRSYTRTENVTSFDYPEDGEEDDINDAKQRELIIQPFSIFFLFIYIVIIITQFICMLWHRSVRPSHV